MTAGPDDNKPKNEKLIAARNRLPSPSGSGAPMSTQEVAEAINAYLWGKHLKEKEAGKATASATVVDHRFVSAYEAGRFWWPSKHYREAFRHVLKVQTDSELGFRGSRSRTKPPPATVKSVVTDGLADGADMRLPEEADDQRRALLFGATAWTAGLASMPRSLLRIAAQESALLGGTSERSPLAASTLESVREDLYQLTTDYVVTSDLPRILVDAIIVRNRLSTLIERRKLRQRELRESYVMMGAVCLLLASVSHDFGESAAGMTQAEAAEVWADLAEAPELHGWVLCTKAMIDLWRGRPYDVLHHAAQGAVLSTVGAASVRLTGLQTRALAQVKRTSEAVTLLRQTESHGNNFDQGMALADLGPMFSFPASRQHYYAAVSYAQLGDLTATERLVAQMGHGDAPPLANGVWPISWALSRSYLALARLDHRGDDGGPDAALQALAPVLTLPDVQRINQLGQVFADIDRRAATPAFAASSSGRALREAVRSFRTIQPPEAISS